MGTPPTTAPPLVPISFPPSSAPHLNSLASGPNTLWGPPSWVPTPTLAKTPVLSLEQRLEDMMSRKIAEAMSKKNSRQQSMVLEEDLFSVEVMAVPLPRDFEQPKMEKYDGSSDPVDHLRAFVDLMRLRATPNAIMCRAFPPTLRREARDWVATLPSKSIRTFDDFSKKFAAYFASSKRAKKTAIGLMQLTQDKDELLKDFTALFNRATLGIKDLQMSAVVTAIMNGTHSHPFKMSRPKNPPDTMHELLRRGDKYVDGEEAFFITKGMKDRKEPESNKRKARDEPRPREDRGKQKMIHPGPNRPSTGKEAHSTPLLTSRANILMEIRNMKELVWPKKMWAPPHRRDETKYCKFHRDHGHDTEDCQQLKEEIERLIKRGQLSKFVGGIAVGGDSNSTQKSYARGNRSTSMDFDVKRVLVDNGSAADVMSWKVFLGLKISPNKIKPVTTPLHGFGGATVIPEGTIELLVTLGTYPASVVIMTSFLLVKAPMAYNTIYGRPLLNTARAVVSTYHQVMKFPTSRRVGCVRGDQQASRRCYLDSISIKNTVMMLDLERPNGRIEPLELTEDVIIAKDQVLKIGGGIYFEEKHKLVACLSENIDVFAWGPQDIEGISPMIAQHRLAILLGTKPIKQKKRQFTPERQQAISTEVAKLLEAGFIRELHYPEWLTNVVLVKKPNGEWRMCVDYTDLNKACPKDSYPLPRIDHLVDATSEHERLSFLDAFSDYHQISMAEGDQEKTSFITDNGTFCYIAMPFGLKNVGATY
ncbi:Ribonuclease H [Abeliophyllum distichum]|uniref:Ribonuclease H n=1 Tax=Abeliophyllum distichum TaxID=126358 RepID=A0ABD1UP04_9LAMI